MAELISEQVKPGLLDLLLGGGAPNVAKEPLTARYEVKRLSEATGDKVIFTLRGLPYGKVQELKRLDGDVEIQILLAGLTDPDVKDRRLAEKFGGPTPAETLRGLLLPGEITDLSRAVEGLSGYRHSTIQEVKNG